MPQILRLRLNRNNNLRYLRWDKDPVYSISPKRIDEKIKVNKKFVLDANVKLFDVGLNPGVSYIAEKEYVEIHPSIVGYYYAAKQDASWDYRTSNNIKEIIEAADNANLTENLKQAINDAPMRD